MQTGPKGTTLYHKELHSLSQELQAFAIYPGNVLKCQQVSLLS